MVGYGFMAHGFAKLARGPSSFITLLQALGVPIPHVMAWATILVELLGGFAVLIGAFVSVISVPMLAVLIVAMFTVHLPYGRQHAAKPNEETRHRSLCFRAVRPPKTPSERLNTGLLGRCAIQLSYGHR